MLAYQGRVQQLDYLKGIVLRIGLYQNSTPPDLATEYDEFTPASFPGYAAATPSFDSVTLDGDDNATTDLSSPVVFTQSSDDTPQTIYGAFLYHFDGVNGFFYSWIEFPTPLVFSETGNTVTINHWVWRQGALDV